MKKICTVFAVITIACLFLMPMGEPLLPKNARISPENNSVTSYVIDSQGITERHTRLTSEEAEKIKETLTVLTNLYQLYGEKNHVGLSVEDKKILDEKSGDLISELKRMGIVQESIDPQSWGILPDFRINLMNTILSIGKGTVTIPFYLRDGFRGFMLRPILVNYPIFGHTFLLHINGKPNRLEHRYWDGSQKFMMVGFTGVYIDFSGLGFDFSQRQVIVGQSFLTLGNNKGIS